MSVNTMTTISLDTLFRSQFGEDRVLWQVFRRRPSGFFVEIGAYDGVTLSNTYFLEQMGWRGLLIEPIPQMCGHASRVRPGSRVVQAAVGGRGSTGTTALTIAQNVPVLSFVRAERAHVDRCLREGAQFIEVQVPFTTVDDILLDMRRRGDEAGNAWVPQQGWGIDLVSIDVEGMELEVLDGFSLDRFKPRVLVMENDRPTGGGIETYLGQRGYRRFHRQKINDFYVNESMPPEDLTLSGFVFE